MENVLKEEQLIQQQMETTTIQTYKTLTSSDYLTDAKMQKLVNTTLHSLESFPTSRQKLMAGIITANGIMSLAVKFTSYLSHERRFTNFFKKLSHAYCILMKEARVSIDREFQQWVDENLFFYYFKYLSLPYSLWESLLRSWLLLEKNKERLELYYSLLQNQLKEENDRSLILLTSLLALACNDGARSVQLLKTLEDLRPNDVLHHFQLFKERNEWNTMKHWFTLFHPHWKSSFGRLQPLYEEMLQETNSEDYIAVWNKWLDRPTFQSYVATIKHYNSAQRQQILSLILPVLKEQSSMPYSFQLFMKILEHEGRFAEGIDYLLIHEGNPIALHPEKQAFIESVKLKEPNLLLPLYHQFVIRLIEKKSRSHYEEAVHYMKELYSIYKNRNEEELYKTYVLQMKSSYKTYRALLQEMKKLESYL